MRPEEPKSSLAQGVSVEEKPPLRCPACLRDEVTRLGKLPDSNVFAGVFLAQDLAGGSLYRCNECCLKFRHPVSEPAAYDALYDNQNTLAWPADLERPDWNRVIEYLAEHRSSGRVLDFGCYTGGLLDRIGENYERYGIEINRAAAAEASRVTGNPTFSSVGEIPAQLRFDVIIACDVVEHMANPIEIIERLGSLLSEDGILILTTGDGENYLWNRFGANWWYCFFPEHISFISEKWLDRSTQDLGLSLQHCETFRYCDLSPLARPLHTAFTYFYGWFPGLYLGLRRWLDKMRGKPGTSSVTGVGVSEDHLLAVLKSSRVLR